MGHGTQAGGAECNMLLTIPALVLFITSVGYVEGAALTYNCGGLTDADSTPCDQLNDFIDTSSPDAYKICQYNTAVCYHICGGQDAYLSYCRANGYLLNIDEQ